MGLTTRFTFALTALQQAALDLATGVGNVELRKAIDFADGAGANQANKAFSDTRTIAASGTDDLDLAGGGLLDALGNALTFTKLKALLVFADPANANNVVVGGDANGVPIFGAVTHTVAIKPGGFFAFVDPSAGGVTVTAATGDIVQIANSGAGTGVNYSVVIIGA